MYTGEYANLGSQRTDLVDTTAVNTLTLIEPSTNDLLLKLVYTLIYHGYLLGILFIEVCVDIVNNGSKSLVANILVVCIKSYLYAVSCKCFDSIKHIVVNFH